MLSQEHSSGTAARVETPEPAATSPDESRADPRVPFVGYPFPIRVRGKTCSIQIRDLSCGGACGLCEEPLYVGAYVTICFAKDHEVEAEVRWVRMMKVGLKFTHPLGAGFVRRLHRANGTFVTVRSKKGAATN